MKPISILFVIALLSGCASAPPRPANIARGDYTTTQAYIDKLIRYEMEKRSVEGLSIALVDNQRVVWSTGFGFADEEKNLAATADTVYRVGSISKLFTDTAAMQLVEQNWLDIDQPLRHYIPDFSIQTRFSGTPEITPRMLMTHHAGLPRDQLKGFMTANPAPFTEVVGDLRESQACYPPNEIFSYSNLGISLLGVAIQKQGGLPFAEFMRRSLLVPMGMTNSSFDSGLSSSALAAQGYQGRKQAAEPALRDIPAGGLNTSVNDLSRFISMVFADGKSGSQQIVKPKTLAEMLRPQNTAVPLDLNFHIGLGWMLSTLGTSAIQNAGLVAHHSGATAYFRSQMYLLPEHKLGVVVLSNSSTSGEVVDHIATETLALALEAKTGIRQPEHQVIMPDSRQLTAETIADYAGDYTTLAGFVKIRACGDGLCAEVADHNFKLVRGTDGLFRLDYALLGIFHINLGKIGEVGFTRRTVEGREVLVASVGTQELLAGQRIKPAPIPDTWRQYPGDYEIANLGADHKFVDRISLIEDHGYLFVDVTPVESYGQKVRIVLMPVSGDEGILLGPLSDGGESVRSVTIDGEKRVLYSGYQLRKIK